MSELEIEKNIPPPPHKKTRGRYPFGQMSVGDSFLFPTKDEAEYIVARNRLSSTATLWAKRHPECRFQMAKVDGGIRVWRIAVEPEK